VDAQRSRKQAIAAAGSKPLLHCQALILTDGDGDVTLHGRPSNHIRGITFKVVWNDKETNVIHTISGMDVDGDGRDNYTRITIEGHPGDPEARIDRFHLYEQYRRKGLGRRIMTILQNAYYGAGTTQMRVYNATAEGARFYKKTGFEACPVTKDLLCNLQHCQAHVTKLAIAAAGDRLQAVLDSQEASAAGGDVSISDEEESAADNLKRLQALFDSQEALFNSQNASIPPAADKLAIAAAGDRLQALLDSQEASAAGGDVLISDEEDSDSEGEEYAESDEDSEGPHDGQGEDAYGIDDPEEYVARPCPPSPVRKRLPKPSARILAQGRTDRNVGELKRPYWDVTVCENAPGHVKLSDQRTGMEYVVPQARVKKAMQFLDHDDVGLCTSPIENKCNCNRRCHEILRNRQVADFRVDLLNAKDEADLTRHMANIIRRNGNKLLLGGKPVCRPYYCQVADIGEGKMQKIVQIAKGESRTGALSTPRTSQTVDPHKDMQTEHSKTFWRWFFNTFCQKPNLQIRLFPVNQSYTEVWENFFQPWWRRSGLAEANKPAQRTWINARSDKEFKDVKKRPKHFHCRCVTCSMLQAQRLNAWKNEETAKQFERDYRLHSESVRAWRGLEDTVTAQARQDPEGTILLYYDDTGAMGFPHMTNRPLKNMPQGRFYVVPWLLINKGLETQDYVYMPKGKWPKGANRLVTQLHAYVSSIKSDVANPQHKARKLILIADNFSENKNATLFQWMQDLVMNKWFDSVEALFGEPGHTHGGDDATHNIHNNPCGNHESADLGQFIYNYPKTFVKNIPGAHILDVIYDWESFYEEFKTPNLQGFTKTKNDPIIARGFRASRGKDNIVHFQWKADPATDSDWRGKDGVEGSLGFFLLRQKSSGFPRVVAPSTKGESAPILKQLLAHGEFLKPYGAVAAARYNHDCAKSGIIRPADMLETSTPTGRWGPLATIGSQPKAQGVVRFIRQVWWPGDNDGVPSSDIWGLPVSTKVQASTLEYHYSGDRELVDARPLPYVRQGTTAVNSSVYSHPNNVLRRANAPTLLQGVRETQSGEWDKDKGKDVYVVDFKHCKKDHFAVMMCKDKKTNKPFIEVAKITKVNKSSKTFQGTKYTCTKDPTTKECLSKGAKWNVSKRSSDNEGFAVIVYIPKLNRGGGLPAPAIAAMRNRELFAEDSAEDEDEDEGDDEEDDEENNDSNSEDE
jgi:GNAT superfamily N-acetyltransferase